MASMFEWVNFNRPDVEFLKGPKEDNSYEWNQSLPNQEEIEQLVENYNPNWVNPNNVPPMVTPRQIRIALIMSGISLQTIEDTIDTLPEPNKSIVRVTWEYSVEFQRSNPFISSMAPLLNLTESQIDQLFTLASTL